MMAALQWACVATGLAATVGLAGFLAAWAAGGDDGDE